MTGWWAVISKSFGTDNTPGEELTLFRFCTKYWSYLLPVWLFPIYLLLWGFAFRSWSEEKVLPLFFVMIGIPFFAVNFRCHKIRKHTSYWRFCLLTGIFPFLIFVAAVFAVLVMDEIRMAYVRAY